MSINNKNNSYLFIFLGKEKLVKDFYESMAEIYISLMQ